MSLCGLRIENHPSARSSSLMKSCDRASGPQMIERSRVSPSFDNAKGQSPFCDDASLLPGNGCISDDELTCRQMHPASRLKKGPSESGMMAPKNLDGLSGLIDDPFAYPQSAAATIKADRLFDEQWQPHSSHGEFDFNVVNLVDLDPIVPGKMGRFAMKTELGTEVAAWDRTVGQHLVPASRVVLAKVTGGEWTARPKMIEGSKPAVRTPEKLEIHWFVEELKNVGAFVSRDY